MKKDFITATPDSGGSGSTTVTVTASANQTESTRSTSLSVAGGGKTQAVSLSQAAVAKISVSPTTVFSSMSSPNTGQSYATTITVSNAPTKPTVSVSMAMKTDGGTIKYQMGYVGKSEPVSAGNNTWTFKVWPANWYQATGGDGGDLPALVPGYYCQGKITVGSGWNTATVNIQGMVTS